MDLLIGCICSQTCTRNCRTPNRNFFVPADADRLILEFKTIHKLKKTLTILEEGGLEIAGLEVTHGQVIVWLK